MAMITLMIGNKINLVAGNNLLQKYTDLQFNVECNISQYGNNDFDIIIYLYIFYTYNFIKKIYIYIININLNNDQENFLFRSLFVNASPKNS